MFSPTVEPPKDCPICLDERQYVNPNGQQWTTLNEMRKDRRKYVNMFRRETSNVVSIWTEPKFAIGQRALLILTEHGNILWDGISFIDEETVERIKREYGGLKAIAISHPHFYTSMIEWSKVFGAISVYIHADDKKWIMYNNYDQVPDADIVCWEGETLDILGDKQATMIRCGGHFDDSCVLHWRDYLFTGDTITVVADKHTTFMYSYPNMIPLPPEAIQKIWIAVKPYSYDRVYGLFNHSTISSRGREMVFESAQRYLKFIGSSPELIQK
jgi:hypothetical protein